MNDTDKLKARIQLAGYFTTHMLIDVMLEGLSDDREEVEIWALNCLREFGRIRRLHNSGKLEDYGAMLHYIQYLEERDRSIP